MKKIHLFIVTLITFSLSALFVACEKDEEIDLTTISVSKEQFTPSYTSASIQCSFNTKATLRNVYVQYATSQDFVEYDEIEMSKADGIYSVVLDGLQDNTTYYIRYAVSNRYSSAMIEEISTFQTLQPSVPTITLKSISDIWDTHAKAEMALGFDGGSSISEMGICWNTQTAPVVENNKLTIKDTIATLEIKDLQPNTQYFVRAYAINKVGVAYSEEFEFTTFSLPEIRTEDITDIHSTIAMLHGTLVFNGNDTATIKGFCWSTNDEPTLENSYVEIDTTSATYTYRLSNLIDETQYYVRAYAQNKIGLVYGETKSFTTQSALPPTVSINEVTNVEYHTATIAAEVTSDGGASVTERGICYSTTENPAIESNKVVSGKGTGDYTANLTGLQDSTTYYVRAYAVNKKGTAYGEQVSFMTKGYKLPTITTANPTNVEYTSATVGGNISSDGGAEITERGICYATTKNPTAETIKIISGQGTGSYTINLTDLKDSTTYYVRAYAINKKGIAYGEQKSFTTKAYALPTVTTSAATNITYTSATVGGNVTSDGGAIVTERGVVYSTSQNPTTSNSKVTNGSGTGSFTCSLNNLRDSTTYYVRAYAINKKGIAYGEQVSFTSEKLPLYFSVSYTKKISFSKGNLQYTQSTKKWSFAENQWEIIGADNVTGGSVSSDPTFGDRKKGTALANKIDLFGWSTNGTYFGVGISTSHSDYSGSFVDWGTNKIGNDTPNTWRTLTLDEWHYVALNRPNADNLKGVAQVNGVNGLILLPDNWICPSDVIFKSGLHSENSVEAYGKYQTFTVDQWSKLESAGAVFLPVSGCRGGLEVGYLQYRGNYWSATEHNSNYAFIFEFYSSLVPANGGGALYRSGGCSIRLVKDL